jgi:hypothetical protein
VDIGNYENDIGGVYVNSYDALEGLKTTWVIKIHSKGEVLTQ